MGFSERFQPKAPCGQDRHVLFGDSGIFDNERVRSPPMTRSARGMTNVNTIRKWPWRSI
jgi:hypothetical protein